MIGRGARNEAHFTAALEQCCRRMQQGEQLDRCLADYPPEYREELTRLVPLAERLGRLARDPSPEVRSRLEQRILASMDEARGRQPEGILERIGRGATALAALFSPRGFLAAAPAVRALVVLAVALLVLAGSGIGAVQASEDALPDSPLYQVKTAREWVEVVAARDKEAQLGVHIRQIGRRGVELVKAVRSGKGRQVVAVLSYRLGVSTVQMVDQALELRSHGKTQPAVRALAVIRTAQSQLDQLVAQASPGVRPPLRRLQRLLAEQAQRLTEGSQASASLISPASGAASNSN